ncbi:MAG: DNA-directed RNA polymerase alpha subunit [Alphaproteobacteria bacterium]|jgi:DNA-directed RNA polymerase alpha subunit
MISREQQWLFMTGTLVFILPNCYWTASDVTEVSARHHHINQRSPSVAKKKPAPHHAVKLDKLVDEKLFAKLSAAGIERVSHVRKLTDAELKAVKGIGAKAIDDIRTAVA